MSSWIPALPFSLPGMPWSQAPVDANETAALGGSGARATGSPPDPLRDPRRFPNPPPPLGHDGDLSPNGSSKRSRTPSEACGSNADEPDRKRRKRGVIGTVLGTALDAAVFSTALTYSAYQLWKHPPSQDDVDAVAQRKQLGLADRPHVALTSTAEAPPPYSELPYSSPKLGGTPLQNGEPAFSGDRADDTDFDFDEEDEEMKAVSERLRTLIETGRDALASRPREWSSNTDSSTTTFATRSRLSTGSSLSTAATAAGASPRIPSPLAPHASKFETPQAQADFTLTDSSRHSRRKSLDAFSRIPRSSPALYDPSSSSTVAVSRDDAARTSSRGHRSSQSHGGGSHNPRHSLGAATERGEGVADEFAKVLDAARRSRRSTGA
ncbi:hypothetical protein JCM3766R1_001919 [Sporobolomyces carnicolor]